MKEKLIRDKLVAKIMEQGNISKVRVAAEDEYRLFLREKLIEEAGELFEALNAVSMPSLSDIENKIVIELADVLEVIDALKKEYNIYDSEIEQAKYYKHKERGGFELGYVLRIDE
jgi:predicted house-cleaning noncanonical NTP pyrophosphatase (MazG superfamily)